MKTRNIRSKHIVFVSDTHFGSSAALSQIHQLDDGGYYRPSDHQKKLYRLWMGFWEYAYKTIKKDPWVLVHVGDIVDGAHHRTTQLSTGNLTIQSRLAIDMMMPHVTRANKYFQIRGTEAHSAPSCEQEEMIAATLGAERDPDAGNYSHWMLWLKFGGKLINVAHHLGVTTSSAYESSALMRETVASFTESGQHKFRAPDILVRGHTHRFLYMRGSGPWDSIKLPAWQLKTAFTHRIDRMRGPNIGGVILSKTSEGIYVRDWTHTVKEQRAFEI
jgi:UDP-2,3-diacylglucosamine pyrophosphatase LpxH